VVEQEDKLPEIEMGGLSLNKKGQIQVLAPAILALVFAAIVLVFGLVMEQELRDTQIGSTSYSVVNESMNFGNTTGYATISKYSGVTGFGGWNATLIMNATTLESLTEGTQYEVYGANGTVRNLTDDYGVNYGFTTTYTYADGGESFSAANQTVVGMGTFADFWEIIVLAIVITIVIGLLLVIFGGRTSR